MIKYSLIATIILVTFSLIVCHYIVVCYIVTISREEIVSQKLCLLSSAIKFMFPV